MNALRSSTLPQATGQELRKQRVVVCRAAQQTARLPDAVAPKPAGNPLLMAAVEALFKFPPFFNAASKKARQMIVQRAEGMGLDWSGAMRELQAQDWNALLKEVTRPGLQYPDYYTKPFHAYTEGNLCWEAALEVTMAAKSVHALVMDPAGKKIDPEGDFQLRRSYSERMKECMSELGGMKGQVKRILDVGAATGLSSCELLQAFPGSSVTAIDLSPHFLAVGKFEQAKREAATGVKESIEFVHGAAESTSLPDGSVDLVSICLVLHELPQEATRNIIKEAYRVLRPGGALSVMEMNPASAAFQRIFANPFAYTAFKSTEPWLQEYISLDLHAAIQDQGFGAPLQKESTPRHRTVVAFKP